GSWAPAPAYHAPASSCGCDTCGTERKGLFGKWKGKWGRHDDCGCDGGWAGGGYGCGGTVVGHPATGGVITTTPSGESIPGPRPGPGRSPLPSRATPPARPAPPARTPPPPPPTPP